MNEHCIEWGGSRSPNGYGQLPRRSLKRQYYSAHRWAYEKFYGPIPPGLYVLHSCDNPPCINPLHLRAGTAKDNYQDSIRRGHNHNRNRDVCAMGHAYDEANTYYDGIGSRHCRTCHRIRERARRAAMKEA